jgi:hypothetical protein
VASGGAAACWDQWGGMDGRMQPRATRVDGSNVMVFCGAGRVAEDQTG